MKKEVLLNWIAALESGRYQIRKGRLRKEDFYCPLGILCDISGQSNWTQSLSEEGEFEYLGENKYLPKEIAEWAGMNEKEKNIVPYVVMAIFDQCQSLKIVIKHLKKSYKIE